MQKAKKNRAEWITAAEAAGILGTTSLNILMHIKRRRLTGREIAGAWQISRGSLEALLSEGPQGGKGELCATGCSAGKGCFGCQ